VCALAQASVVELDPAGTCLLFQVDDTGPGLGEKDHRKVCQLRVYHPVCLFVCACMYMCVFVCACICLYVCLYVFAKSPTSRNVYACIEIVHPVPCETLTAAV
jgi:hypothetical protein